MNLRLISIAVLYALVAGTANAAVISFDFNNPFSGTSPAGAGSWLNATFVDSVGGVSLQISTYGLSGAESVKSVYLNLDPLLDATQLSFQYTGGKTGSVQTGTDQFKADGDGKYDILIEFGAGSNGFAARGTSDWLLSGVGSLGAWSFDYLSKPAGGHGPFKAAAHVQGIGPAGLDSGWVSASVSEVPIPPAAGLLAAGLAFLGARLRRRTEAD